MWNKQTRRILPWLVIACAAAPVFAAGPAQTGVVASNVKSDITTHGISLNGAFIPGGPVNNVTASQAKLKVNGQCQFEMSYHAINKGEAATAPAFRNRLLRNGAVVVQHDNLILAANQGQVKTFNVFLQPGMNSFELYLDADKQVAESNEANNFRVAKINLTGSCLDKLGSPRAPAAGPNLPRPNLGIQQKPAR